MKRHPTLADDLRIGTVKPRGFSVISPVMPDGVSAASSRPFAAGKFENCAFAADMKTLSLKIKLSFVFFQGIF